MKMNERQRSTYTLRLDDELKSWLAERAKKNDRSMNAEVVSLLRYARSFEEAKELKAA
jgi:plasmid stability protein